MYIKRITLAEIKQEAKDLKKINPTIKHTEALNQVAQKYGYEKYEILKSKADANSNIDIPMDILEVLPSLRSKGIALNISPSDTSFVNSLKIDSEIKFPLKASDIISLLNMRIKAKDMGKNSSYFFNQTIILYSILSDIYFEHISSEIKNLDSFINFWGLCNLENVFKILFFLKEEDLNRQKLINYMSNSIPRGSDIFDIYAFLNNKKDIKSFSTLKSALENDLKLSLDKSILGDAAKSSLSYVSQCFFGMFFLLSSDGDIKLINIDSIAMGQKDFSTKDN